MLILLSMILFAQAPSYATETPNPGPRSNNEAQFLYDEGIKAFDDGRYDLSQKDLERLIDRYPSHPNAIQSYPKLVVIYSTILHDDAKTIQTVQKYLHLAPKAKDALDLKAILASSYLSTGKWAEARITSEEILKSNDASDSLKAAALVLKIESLSQQKRYREANASLDALETQIEKISDKAAAEKFKKDLPAMRLTLRTRECSTIALPVSSIKRGAKKKKYTEDDYLDYFGRKNTCLKTALPENARAIGPDNRTSLQLWCQTHETLTKQLKNEAMDSFLKEKISKTLSDTQAFAKDLNPELVQCQSL